MNLHEYQAKQLFREYGLPVSKGFAVQSAAAAIDAAKEIGGDMWVIKAQVHAGGRGKAGGVKLVKSAEEIKAFCDRLLGTRLVTYQTDAKGQPVETILIESCTDIAKELYLGAVVDRASRRIVFMASTEGGVEIEEVAHSHPEKILKAIVDPLVGAQPYQARELGFKLGLNDVQIGQFTKIFMGLAKLFQDFDFSLLEINPLVITEAGQLHCLDGKINIDDNAMYRHPRVTEMRDSSQEDEREEHAQRHGINYVALEGDIGCMVNGAGLAMATMDIIKLSGGAPANFLDVGGGANKDRVVTAFKLILSDPSVKAVLVNIFGGIVRCDMIAEGIIEAVAEVGIKIPVVVRLEGTNAELGLKKLAESGLNIIAASGFSEAAHEVVRAAKNA